MALDLCGILCDKHKLLKNLTILKKSKYTNETKYTKWGDKAKDFCVCLCLCSCVHISDGVLEKCYVAYGTEILNQS